MRRPLPLLVDPRPVDLLEEVVGYLHRSSSSSSSTNWKATQWAALLSTRNEAVLVHQWLVLLPRRLVSSINSLE